LLICEVKAAYCLMRGTYVTVAWQEEARSTPPPLDNKWGSILLLGKTLISHPAHIWNLSPLFIISHGYS
jgi:hypothetical protein